ncbi:hypothetical protein GIB67_027818 [Kingdonia uniflora]|uniref:Uncharacterized protein n=1 Tax=Kingdonia uniflora TaxID=39325 RepID=A0A7J7MHZ4_9MAGN|nr:hypothetical protein GIB67_027818 [Kingdonia uniflora]
MFYCFLLRDAISLFDILKVIFFSLSELLYPRVFLLTRVIFSVSSLSGFLFSNSSNIFFFFPSYLNDPLSLLILLPQCLFKILTLPSCGKTDKSLCTADFTSTCGKNGKLENRRFFKGYVKL